MRTQYYNLLKENKIVDVLSKIDELSYSKKINLITLLLNKFNNVSIINRALIDYKINYIDLNRINLMKLKNVLIYLCKKNGEEL